MRILRCGFHRDTLHLDQQPRMRQPGNADTSPGATTAGEQAIFYAAKDIHMRFHTHMIGSHFHHIGKGTARLGQHRPQVFPAGDKLGLRVVNHLQFRCSTDLSGAVERIITDKDGRRVTGPFGQRLHGGRHNDFSDWQSGALPGKNVNE